MTLQVIRNDDGEPIGTEYVYDPDPNDWADSYEYDGPTWGRVTCQACGHETDDDCCDEINIVVLSRKDGIPSVWRKVTSADYHWNDILDYRRWYPNGEHFEDDPSIPTDAVKLETTSVLICPKCEDILAEC